MNKYRVLFTISTLVCLVVACGSDGAGNDISTYNGLWTSRNQVTCSNKGTLTLRDVTYKLKLQDGAATITLSDDDCVATGDSSYTVEDGELISSKEPVSAMCSVQDCSVDISVGSSQLSLSCPSGVEEVWNRPSDNTSEHSHIDGNVLTISYTDPEDGECEESFDKEVSVDL